MSTRIEEIRANLDVIEEWARETPDWPNWDEQSLRDVRALLGVAEAVAKETRAWGSCPLCHRWLNHTEVCPMRPLVEATP